VRHRKIFGLGFVRLGNIINKAIFIVALGGGDGAKSLALLKQDPTTMAGVLKSVLQTQLDAVGMGRNYEVNDDDLKAWVKGMAAP